MLYEKFNRIVSKIKTPGNLRDKENERSLYKIPKTTSLTNCKNKNTRRQRDNESKTNNCHYHRR